MDNVSEAAAELWLDSFNRPHHVLDVARKVGAKGIQMSADRPPDQ